MTSEPTAPGRLAVFLRRRLLLVFVGLALLGLAVGIRLATDRARPSAGGPTVVWMFEQPQRGAILSAPVVTADCIYVAALRDNALSPSGVVYGLDRRDGTVRWTFDDAGSMLHTISTPCLADGRLYVGEGMHGNNVCKMYCLDAATGRKLWQFVTGGHIESSPSVADGAVYFGSGDDGIYCLDAASGVKRWQFHGRWHVDVRPAVVGGRVYAGSGVSRLNHHGDLLSRSGGRSSPLADADGIAGVGFAGGAGRTGVLRHGHGRA